MAAGMGSRFGGLKQTEPITADGKVILDFSVYDAIKAGFSKVVFIIREEMYAEFKYLVGDRISKNVDVEYVFQDVSALPVGREKPFGTGHAVLCCKETVKEPFAIINADDYYGKQAFELMHKHLSNAKQGECAMVAFELQNTLSKNGAVSRGLCVEENGYLKSVKEIKEIYPDGSYSLDGKTIVLDKSTPISMNIWGLTTDIFDILEKEYQKFLETADLTKDELYIPSVISKAIKNNQIRVKTFKTLDKWYGITYRNDLEEIKEAIGGYINYGLYEGI
jgi:UTP-glucose-1-phosphate uridylyltransferase